MTDRNEALRLADSIHEMNYSAYMTAIANLNEKNRQQAERIAELEVARAIDTFGHNVMAGRAQLQMVRLESRLHSLTSERDQLRADVERLRAMALQAPWRHLDLDAVSDAFSDVIEAHHARKNPFHNPLNHRAVIALRELKTIIPYMKAIAARTTHKDN